MMSTSNTSPLFARLAERVLIGHDTDLAARTGCTVVLFDRLVPAIVDVRGGAPGTRETNVTAPGRLVQAVDAILLTGGSAYGLAAADGVMAYLADQGRGFPTIARRVPIVPAAVLYDLGVGQPVAPTAASGRAACENAGPVMAVARGQVGAGTGATTGKIGGRPVGGGLGLGRAAFASHAVLAVAAVNALGDVVDPATGRLLFPRPDAGTSAEARERALAHPIDKSGLGESTTLVVVVVAGPCSRDALVHCGIAAHDGLAHVIRPCHTIYDGDIVFAVSLDERPATAQAMLQLAFATEIAVEQAVIDAVTA